MDIGKKFDTTAKIHTTTVVRYTQRRFKIVFEANVMKVFTFDDDSIKTYFRKGYISKPILNVFLRQFLVKNRLRMIYFL